MSPYRFQWLGDLAPGAVRLEPAPQPRPSLPPELAAQLPAWIEAFEAAGGRLTRDADGELPPLVRLCDQREAQGELILSTGSTDYAEYLFTNVERPELRGTLGPGAMADALAVCGALVTGDGQVLVCRRSTATAEGAGQLHVVPAGHLELGASPSRGLLAELEEEAGLVSDELTAFRWCGLMRVTRSGKPELLAWLSTALTLDEVLARPRRDGWEFETLFGVEWQPAVLGQLLARRPLALVPPGHGCLLAAGRLAFGQAWFEPLAAGLA